MVWQVAYIADVASKKTVSVKKNNGEGLKKNSGCFFGPSVAPRFFLSPFFSLPAYGPLPAFFPSPLFSYERRFSTFDEEI